MRGPPKDARAHARAHTHAHARRHTRTPARMRARTRARARAHISWVTLLGKFVGHFCESLRGAALGPWVVVGHFVGHFCGSHAVLEWVTFPRRIRIALASADDDDDDGDDGAARPCYALLSHAELEVSPVTPC